MLEDSAVALVTGSSSGIGKAIAQRLARDGYRVVVHGRDEDRTQQIAAEIREAGGSALPVVADLTHSPEVERVVKALHGEWGRADVLVNNAGTAESSGSFETTPAENWRKMLGINLDSAMEMTQQCLPLLRQSPAGSIVQVASNLAIAAIPGLAAYSAAKAGLLGFTRGLAVELGPDRIRVNAVCPGLVATPLTTGRPDFDQHRTLFEQGCALGRIGQPEDIAGAVAFLAGKDASWMTGQALVIDGGSTIAG